MKINKNIIILLAILGFLILFFFPEPETNFLVYIATMLFFVFLIVFLIIKSKQKN